MITTTYQAEARPITYATAERQMTRADLDRIIEKISFAPSGLDFDWQFDVRETPDSAAFEVRSSFMRPDTQTGVRGRGYGRWERIEKDASPSGVVKTCYVCCRLIADHELMEAFLYNGIRIFDPHNELEALALAQFLGSRPIAFDAGDLFHQEVMIRLLNQMAGIPAYVKVIDDVPFIALRVIGPMDEEPISHDMHSQVDLIAVPGLDGKTGMRLVGHRWDYRTDDHIPLDGSHSAGDVVMTFSQVFLGYVLALREREHLTKDVEEYHIYDRREMK